jgi:hypothetical protein
MALVKRILQINMPYIKKEDRPKFDGVIKDVVNALTEHGYAPLKVGELNYVFSSIIWKLWESKKSYANGSSLCAVLGDVEAEFRRRKFDPYENEKIKENGDL